MWELHINTPAFMIQSSCLGWVLYLLAKSIQMIIKIDYHKYDIVLKQNRILSGQVVNKLDI